MRTVDTEAAVNHLQHIAVEKSQHHLAKIPIGFQIKYRNRIFNLACLREKLIV